MLRYLQIKKEKEMYINKVSLLKLRFKKTEEHVLFGRLVGFIVLDIDVYSRCDLFFTCMIHTVYYWKTRLSVFTLV